MRYKKLWESIFEGDFEEFLSKQENAKDFGYVTTCMIENYQVVYSWTYQFMSFETPNGYCQILGDYYDPVADECLKEFVKLLGCKTIKEAIAKIKGE